MTEIHGKYADARVYADIIDSASEGQIKALCDMPHVVGSKICIMPDVHAGKGCTVGTTMTLNGRVIPALVGVDIGCGMLVVRLREKRVRLPELDSFIRKNIPGGRAVRAKPHRFAARAALDGLLCAEMTDLRRAGESMGTLGGGNHFIEIDTDGEALYLVIHSGSRAPGGRVAEYYQALAYERCGGRKQNDIPYCFAYLEGDEMQAYLHDMNIMQDFARLNREAIAADILDGMKLRADDSFATVHNYIDVVDGGQAILRKGAVSAKAGERLLIPMNMRDGSLLCTGLGNEDWNMSAPHGAGRLMSRADARDHISVSEFKKAMSGIFTTSVSRATVDESPMAYKPPESIISNIGDTVAVDGILRPIYNFKAGEND